MTDTSWIDNISDDDLPGIIIPSDDDDPEPQQGDDNQLDGREYLP